MNTEIPNALMPTRRVIKYNVVEEQAIQSLLRTVPRGPGMLPFRDFQARPEWQLLRKNHSDHSIQQKMTKVWKTSVLKITPAAPAPEPPKETPKELNHAFNFCPNCGFALNL